MYHLILAIFFSQILLFEGAFCITSALKCPIENYLRLEATLDTIIIVIIAVLTNLIQRLRYNIILERYIGYIFSCLQAIIISGEPCRFFSLARTRFIGL